MPPASLAPSWRRALSLVGDDLSRSSEGCEAAAHEPLRGVDRDVEKKENDERAEADSDDDHADLASIHASTSERRNRTARPNLCARGPMPRALHVRIVDPARLSVSASCAIVIHWSSSGPVAEVARGAL